MQSVFSLQGALGCVYWFLILQVMVTEGDSIETELFQRVEVSSCPPTTTTTLASLSPVSTLPECARHCSLLATCTAFTSSPLTATCQLLSDVTMSGGCEAGGEGNTWIRVSTQSTSQTPCENGGVDREGGGCQCVQGYVGQYCHRLMEDCQEGLDSGHYPDMGWSQGALTAHPSLSPHNMSVLCRNNGMTMVLRQIGQHSTGLNFTWEEYQDSFTLSGNFGAHWLGLQNLYYFTNSRPYDLSLCFWLTDLSMHCARYENFVITNDDNFTASLGAYVSGPSDLDVLGDIDGQPFSTYDHDYHNPNHTRCALERGGGWWYGGDCSSHGLYNLVGRLEEVADGSNLTGAEYVHFGTVGRAGYIRTLILALERH